MARPRKNGMDYFPHDTDARNDMKIRKLRAVYGNDGYTTYFILLENIFRNKNYEIDISDAETLLILAEECRLSEDKFTLILQKCIDLGLFDKQLYESSKILGGEAIKKRTEQVENKRIRNSKDYNSSKKEVSDAETSAEIDISDTETPTESTQRKEKNSIENNKGKNNKIKIYDMFTSNGFGTISPIMKEKIDTLIGIYSEEWVIEAINRSVEKNIHTLSYINAILQNFHANGGIDNKSNSKKGGIYGQPRDNPYSNIDFEKKPADWDDGEEIDLTGLI